jgi:S-DNA-T family DNA segregation ATPase FtsK/SpoIIIE
VKRLAQISRAVGVHIILATQRPSIKVIGGDIKANFPARIAFKLATMQDSRVILDENGAEKLLGKGDYLYKTATTDNAKRAHSAFVSMTDIKNMINQHDMLREQLSSLRG